MVLFWENGLDYLEEQQNELEALQSIYPEEFEGALSLWVKYTPTYPDELPEYSVDVTEGRLTDAQKQRAEESLGMVMIFTMASLAKEELNQIVEDTQRSKEEADLERIRKEEEIENARFRGTKLTWERFQEWRAKFEKELAEQESEEKKARAKELKNKLTGRQLFEQDKTLALSDTKYMEEGDVSVDASQYEKEEQVQSNDDDNDDNAVWRQFGTED
ncbi:ubiquitin-conjugating enzyme/RWD-like protein [Phascolomyces articulosus]|uniref:Ubiquitin-conjugating enzyme/RWD-like protein n=1 Tax=Phascolomyces articulosus TaxID=60185 RepID=A0AAD5K584_9FUNG|nr:ubiquitin-conjugating enzyme/RWD-like protein [Phascolomyces articulosus]